MGKLRAKHLGFGQPWVVLIGLPVHLTSVGPGTATIRDFHWRTDFPCRCEGYSVQYVLFDFWLLIDACTIWIYLNQTIRNPAIATHSQGIQESNNIHSCASTASIIHHFDNHQQISYVSYVCVYSEKHIWLHQKHLHCCSHFQTLKIGTPICRKGLGMTWSSPPNSDVPQSLPHMTPRPPRVDTGPSMSFPDSQIFPDLPRSARRLLQRPALWTIWVVKQQRILQLQGLAQTFLGRLLGYLYLVKVSRMYSLKLESPKVDGSSTKQWSKSAGVLTVFSRVDWYLKLKVPCQWITKR